METIRFFEEIQNGDYELFVSEMVMIEIRRAPETIRNKLLAKISQIEPEELEVTQEIRRLAAKYAEAGFLAGKAYEDMVHAATATVNNMDFLVSWNLKHIVKIKTIAGINAINILEGYRELKICDVWGGGSDE